MFKSNKKYRQYKKSREYKDYITEGLISIGVISSITIFCILIYFLVQDLFIAHFPIKFWIWRIPPIVLAIISFISFKTIKNKLIIQIIYYTFLASIMVMMCVITAGLVHSDIFDASLTALTLIIFGIFICYLGKVRILALIYIIPFGGLLLYLAFMETLSKKEWLSVSNPIAAIFGALVIALVNERLRLKEYIHRSEIEDKNLKIEQELVFARNVQQKIIPIVMPDIDGLDISAVYEPMMEVGGDYYDFIKFREDEDLLGIFISDVSGHGVSAALITSMIKALISAAGIEKRFPSYFLEFLNRNLYGDTGDNFITAFYGIYNNVNKMLYYSRGGHNYPFLVRKNKIIELRGKGSILGIFKNIKFTDSEIQLMKDDVILFYTDGLVEAVNTNREAFENTFLKILNQNSNSITMENLVSIIIEELRKFTKRDIFEDDVCIIAMKINN